MPDNKDGLWRQYHGSALFHRYGETSFANYQTQVALCGRTTRTGSGSYSVLGSPLTKPICRKCEKLLADRNKSADDARGQYSGGGLGWMHDLQ